MTTPGGRAIPLQMVRAPGGDWRHTWSLTPGRRITLTLTAAGAGAADADAIGRAMIDSMLTPYPAQAAHEGEAP